MSTTPLVRSRFSPLLTFGFDQRTALGTSAGVLHQHQAATRARGRRGGRTRGTARGPRQPVGRHTVHVGQHRLAQRCSVAGVAGWPTGGIGVPAAGGAAGGGVGNSVGCAVGIGVGAAVPWIVLCVESEKNVNAGGNEKKYVVTVAGGAVTTTFFGGVKRDTCDESALPENSF